MRNHSIFLSIDDKHKVKIGEPDVPVASDERWRPVIVPVGSQLLAADHDFTKFSIVPSVILCPDIPEKITGSWYDSQVMVMLKEGAFEPSSPARHSAEMTTIIEREVPNLPVLFIYSDGGPDHRLTYLSVKLALIALYLKLDLDYLCAARTVPYHSYRNPVERIMSIFNLGLQAVALAREKMPDEIERLATSCNNLKTLRKVAEGKAQFRDSCMDAIAPAKVVLSDVVRRLELKEKKFQIFTAATQDELDELWTSLAVIDKEFQVRHNEKINAKNLSKGVAEFLSHCCRERHYFFDILKCGKSQCSICSPPRLPVTDFAKLGHLPDPLPGNDGHYKPFDEVFRKTTTEDHRPSKSRIKQRALPFYPSVQHVTNTQMMLMCEECSMWRLICSKRKLKQAGKIKLEQALDGMSFSCGAQLQDANIPEHLKDTVFVRRISCEEPVEKLYYSAKFQDICVHCAADEVAPWSDLEPHCPQCDGCSDKPKIPNAKKIKNY